MCGIAGALRFDGTGVERDRLDAMVRALWHRGPDANGVFVDGPLGLGHTRLSIVDLTGGVQPMTIDDGRYAITFNGEIFNHVELREQLQKKGRQFATHSDTEAILHMFAEYGEDCVKQFNGQWAFAIWDRKDKRLFMSRDRLGVRPLYYTTQNNALRFASEVKAIFQWPDVRRAMDRKALAQIFTFWSAISPRTVFEEISELPPGHSMWVEPNGKVQIKRYWDITYSPDKQASEADLVEELRATLVDAARLRLVRADVPVGAYLSGGIDSSAICGMVKHFTDTKLKTFSVTFSSPEYDESVHQQKVVDFLGVEHRSINCTGIEIGRAFPEVTWFAEQPMIRTAPAPLFLLSGLVRESGYKVVLTGEGSDELLGGYDIFKEAVVRRFWARQPDSKSRPLLLKKLYPYIPGLQAQSNEYLKAFFHVTPEAAASPFFSHLPRWELTQKLQLFFSGDTKSELTGYDPLADMHADLPSDYAKWDPFYQSQFLETRYLLAGYLLSTQGDRMGMGHGIEGRYPFLDPRVVDVASRVPAKLKMKVLNEKYILKQAVKDVIPPFLLDRPKQPYRAPVAECFFDTEKQKARFDYVEELLSKEALERYGLFASAPVAKLVDKARKGQIVGVKDGMAIVGILSAQLVANQLVDRMEKINVAN